MEIEDEDRAIFYLTNFNPLQQVRELFPFPKSYIQIKNYLENIVFKYIEFHRFVSETKPKDYKKKQGEFKKKVFVTAEHLMRIRVPL